MNANRHFRLVPSQSITPYQNGSRLVERCLALVLRSFSEGGCEAEGSPPQDLPAVIGTIARQSLIAEAELTPKPGLVDRRGPGAHTDLSLALMIRSAFAIEPFIRLMAFQSTNENPSPRLRATLTATGRAAERAMLEVTNGSNTHKGAIWTLGLLAAAAVRDELPLIRRRDNATCRLNAKDIATTAGLIASFEDPYESAPNAVPSVGPTPNAKRRTPNAKRQTPNAPLSHGQIVAQKFGVPGARGEAIQGFPHIVEVGLPTLRARRSAGAPESIARLDALLAIMARLTDTCLLYRGGRPALLATQQGAAAVIAAGGAGTSRGREELFALDQRLLELGASPGGSADLLAGTLFLDAIEPQQTGIRPSEIDEREITPITFHQSRPPVLAP
jgi:triphosphoribosyl-dephospho-CoA synthase